MTKSKYGNLANGMRYLEFNNNVPSRKFKFFYYFWRSPKKTEIMKVCFYFFFVDLLFNKIIGNKLQFTFATGSPLQCDSIIFEIRRPGS